MLFNSLTHDDFPFVEICPVKLLQQCFATCWTFFAILFSNVQRF